MLPRRSPSRPYPLSVRYVTGHTSEFAPALRACKIALSPAARAHALQFIFSSDDCHGDGYDDGGPRRCCGRGGVVGRGRRQSLCERAPHADH
eukprot:4107006-Prymnesium_polylepis.1